MNAPLHKGEAGFVARFEGLRDRLPGDRAARDFAATAFRATGLPSLRNEAWKYTNLRPVAEAMFREPLTALDDAALRDPLSTIEGARMVFVDGRYHSRLSVVPPGIRVASFADEPRFGGLAHPEREPLVALNTMLAEDGAVIEVDRDVDAGLLHLVSLAGGAQGQPVAFHPRHRVHLAEGARLTLLEISRGEGSYLHNPVSEITVAAGAKLTHVRLQDESPEGFHLSTVYADIAETGVYDCFVLNVGGRLCRTEVRARLSGPGSIAHLNGAQLLAGRQHADFTTVVSHDAPSCASRQTVKNVLAGRSRGVFQGRIEVAREAQKTDGYQMNQALLLSPEAEVDSKPELEIFADDVKCSHGATVGELDLDQLFYLRSRGIPEGAARSILVRAFLDEALALVENETARAVLDAAVEGWWERQAA